VLILVSDSLFQLIMNKSLVGMVCGLSAAAIWGGMYVVSKVVLDVIPPFTLVTVRLLLGGLTLWLIRILRGGMKTEAEQFWRVFGVGLIGYGISLGFQFVGTKLSTAANASLVTSATPAFILVFAWLILRERITILRLAALLVSTIGVLAVIDPRTAELNPMMFWGNISLLAAALTWALYSVLIRIVTRELDILTVSLIAFLGGLPVVVPAGALELTKGGIGPVNVGILGGVLFLGIISTALAMVLWNTAFAFVDASLASLTFFAQPVVGSLLGWFFLKETITPLFLLGGFLILAGLVMASRETGT
jgi:drug/metabolite transporter (DMT)-like permease